MIKLVNSYTGTSEELKRDPQSVIDLLSQGYAIQLEYWNVHGYDSKSKLFLCKDHYNKNCRIDHNGKVYYLREVVV